MIRLVLIAVATLLFISLSNAGPAFYPPLADTIVISLDPLHLSVYAGEANSFTCNWTIVHKDSVLWTIDGRNVDSTDAYLSQGTNPKELSPVYSTGAGLSLKQNAFIKYAQGVHKVELIAKFQDSLITAAWYFRCYETKYREFRAKVVVDSSWSEYNPYKSNFNRYRIVSAEPLDTSLFSNANSFFGTQADSLIKYDTTSIMKLIVSKNLQPPSSDITFECFVLQVLRGNEKYNEWRFSNTFDSFVKCIDPPFELSEALRLFNVYAKNVSLPKGYDPQKGDFRLGPVLKLSFGDPGWSLNAFNDSSFWYFEYRVGSGDCPAGCIFWKKDLFQIAHNGSVSIIPVSAHQLNPSRNLIPSNVYAAQKRFFTLNGQLLRNNLPAKQMTNGVYIGPSLQTNSKDNSILILQ